MQPLGRALMIMGGALFLLGLFLVWSERIPGLGHLPGDLRVQRGPVTIYVPFGAMIVLSIVLTIALNLITRIWR